MRSRVRFTTATMMLAILIVGLNLAGGLATSKYYPRRYLARAVVGNLAWGYTTPPDEDGLVYSYRAHDGRLWLSSVNRVILPPTLPRIWSPVVASVSISLVLLLLRRRQTHLRDIAILAPLVALNLAAFASRPEPEGWTIEMDNRRTIEHRSKDGSRILESWTIGRDCGVLFGGAPRMLLIRIDGTVVQRHRMDGSDLGLGFFVPGEPADRTGYAFDEATIEFGRDGHIVSYAGSPEHRLSEPYVIRPSTLSLLELWWPVIGSVGITMLVFLLLWRRRFCHPIRLRPRPGIDQASAYPPDRPTPDPSGSR